MVDGNCSYEEILQRFTKLLESNEVVLFEDFHGVNKLLRLSRAAAGMRVSNWASRYTFSRRPQGANYFVSF